MVGRAGWGTPAPGPLPSGQGPSTLVRASTLLCPSSQAKRRSCPEPTPPLWSALGTQDSGIPCPMGWSQPPGPEIPPGQATGHCVPPSPRCGRGPGCCAGKPAVNRRGWERGPGLRLHIHSSPTPQTWGLPRRPQATAFLSVREASPAAQDRLPCPPQLLWLSVPSTRPCPALSRARGGDSAPLPLPGGALRHLDM